MEHRIASHAEEYEQSRSLPALSALPESAWPSHRGRHCLAGIFTLLLFLLLAAGFQYVHAGPSAGDRSARQTPLPRVSAENSGNTVSAIEEGAERFADVFAPQEAENLSALAGESAGFDGESLPAPMEMAKPSVQPLVELPWNLLLANAEHPLPEAFSVPSLSNLPNGHAIDSRAYPSLQQMLRDARDAGARPYILSSFRTWATQRRLFNNRIVRFQNDGYARSTAEVLAARWVAPPGTSEHQVGLALDIVDQNFQSLTARQASTVTQQWLMAHCAEYGFILRYPKDKTQITGIGYEPWHYRYVGVEAAREITENGLCLEEYVALLSGQAGEMEDISSSNGES